MAQLLVNYNAAPGAGNADASEAMTTSTVKSTGTKTTTSRSGEIEFFSTAAHLVHVGSTPDADGATAFYVFPNFPKRVKCGVGVKVSAKSLV